MNDDNGPLERLLAVEETFHELMPGKDIYSKLLFRSILWFTLITVVYTVVTST